MKVWGHRGASAYAPENTMEAFKIAAEQGADGIETDVHMTKDGVLVLMHDEKLDRTTDHQGYIKDYTFAELQKVNANNHREGFDFCHIPTLEELLKLAKEENMELNIEVKTDSILYENIEKKIYDMVAVYGLEDKVLYSSFNHYSLKKLREIDPTVKIGLLYMEAIYQPWHYANWMEADALHPYYPCCALDDYIANAHLHQVKVHPWTVNRKEDMLALKAAGVDAIITNDPALAKTI